MDYESRFRACVAGVRAEGRYRMFADLARRVGNWPRASWRRPDGAERAVVVWCSNDYLGLGHHPGVLEEAGAAVRAYGAGGTRNIAGTTRLHVALEAGLALQPSLAALAGLSGINAAMALHYHKHHTAEASQGRQDGYGRHLALTEQDVDRRLAGARLRVE